MSAAGVCSLSRITKLQQLALSGVVSGLAPWAALTTLQQLTSLELGGLQVLQRQLPPQLQPLFLPQQVEAEAMPPQQQEQQPQQQQQQEQQAGAAVALQQPTEHGGFFAALPGLTRPVKSVLERCEVFSSSQSGVVQTVRSAICGSATDDDAAAGRSEVDEMTEEQRLDVAAGLKGILQSEAFDSLVRGEAEIEAGLAEQQQHLPVMWEAMHETLDAVRPQQLALSTSGPELGPVHQRFEMEQRCIAVRSSVAERWIASIGIALPLQLARDVVGIKKVLQGLVVAANRLEQVQGSHRQEQQPQLQPSGTEPACELQEAVPATDKEAQEAEQALQEHRRLLQALWCAFISAAFGCSKHSRRWMPCSSCGCLAQTRSRLKCLRSS
jgi:hypothetical protein